MSSSLSLPDKTLQFVKDHPLMDSSVTPIDNRPRLIRSDVNYTQVVVDRTWALDGTPYDVMFVGTGGSRPQGQDPSRSGSSALPGPPLPTEPQCSQGFTGESPALASKVCDHPSPGPCLGVHVW